jgi:hypothetical protein
MSRDWVRWHEGYDDPASPLNARLALVQRHLSDGLAAAPPGPVSLVSLCAGQGGDVLGVLPAHPRRTDVRAVLVEIDPHNARIAQQRVAQAGLTGVQVRHADAAAVAGYADALPANVLLLCGIFGNITEADIARTIAAAPALCAPGGIVIWTRHRRPPDLTSQLREWFAEAGFEELAFDSPDTAAITGVGVHRRAAAAEARSGIARLSAERLFTFTFDQSSRPADAADDSTRA